MEHFYRRIPGWFGYSALYSEQVARVPADQQAWFVEVGSWKGRSAAYMAVEIANSGKKINFFCVDHWQGSDEPAHHADKDIQDGKLYEVFTRNTAPAAKFIIPLRMSSIDAAKQFKDESIDFVMLDGAHDLDSVTADIAAWLPKIKPGGVISGDDWNWTGVKGAARAAFGEKIEILGDGKHRHWKVQL